MLYKLRERIRGKRTVILGIGNPLRGDDGLGTHLTTRMQGRVNALVVNAGDVPENYLEPIMASKPEVVIIVDAAALGDSPGAMAIIEVDALDDVCFSTHNASLKLFVKALRAVDQPDVFLLGVQPEIITIGAPISRKVARAIDILEQLLLNVLLENTHAGQSISLS